MRRNPSTFLHDCVGCFVIGLFHAALAPLVPRVPYSTSPHKERIEFPELRKTQRNRAPSTIGAERAHENDSFVSALSRSMSEQALRRAQLQAALNSPPPASPSEQSGSGRGSGRGFRQREANEGAEGHGQAEHAHHDEEVAATNTLPMSPTAHTSSVEALGVTFGEVMIHEMPHEQRQQWEAEEARRRFAKGLLPASSLVRRTPTGRVDLAVLEKKLATPQKTTVSYY
jgi:hypothetical protein